MLRKILAHPLTRGMDLDSPETSELRRQIIKEKEFLNRIYQEWYQIIVDFIPDMVAGQVLELGSGGGFLSEVFSDVIKSDIIFLSTNNVVVDAHNLPFKSNSLRAIVMTNVLHHIPRPVEFFQSAANCIRPGGRILMIDHWVSTWSRFIFKNFHHEPFDSKSTEWYSLTQGPLSGANSAMPWILFYRDKDKFSLTFQEWSVNQMKLMMPFRYLLSGGVSLRSIMPGFSYNAWKWIENLLDPIMDKIAMFAFISLERKAISELCEKNEKKSS